MATMMMTTTIVAAIEQSYYRRSRRRRRRRTIPTSTLVVATKSRLYVLSLLSLFLIIGGTTNVLVSTAFVITTTTTTTHHNNYHFYHDELSLRRKKTTTTKTNHQFSSSARTSTTPLCVVHPQPRQRHDNINDENVENTETKELLSVAPMMGHTNRHYRYYYRLLSKRTYLYTEMMPSSQIVSAYNRAKEIYNIDLPKSTKSESTPTPNEIINLVQQVIDNPSLEYQSAAIASKSLPYEVLTLHQLLATSCSQESPVVLQLGGNDPTTLGIAAAIGAAWGRCSRWNQDYSQQQNSQQSSQSHSQSQHSQSHYISINLNCGCPSNAVGGRAGGCALMATPELVLECVNSMKSSIDEIYNTLLLQEESSSLLSEQQQSKQQQSQQSILSTPPHPPPTITVKHRLGIRDAISYNATFDRLQNDDEAFKDVSSFIRTVSSNDSVSTFHVHARLGILGDFVDDTNDDDGNDEEEEDDDENNNNKNKKKKKIQQTLWVPTDDDDGATTTDTNTDNNKEDGEGEEIRIKIDHKREQEKARRRSRRSTIKNRDVPPLRPNVIYKLTTEFPHLDFVSNGGITNMKEVVKEVTGNGDVLGAMVGRTIINHPCSFASADQLLWNDESNDRKNDDTSTSSSSSSSSSSEIKRRPTRGDILLNYIKYCDEEEDRIVSYGASQQHMENLRRRLIAVPYHLFVGENGSDKYQRRIIKLKDKLQRVVTTTSTSSSGTTTNKNKDKNPNQRNRNTMTMKASTILKGAMSFIPKTTLDKCIDDYVEWDDIPKYDHLGGLKRGSALQRVVY